MSVRTSDPELSFDGFVRARLPHLLRFGRALTGDDATAGALVEHSLAPVLARWSPDSAGSAEDDVRRAMVARFLHRRALRSDTSAAPEAPLPPRDQPVWAALATLSPRSRCYLALRLHEELDDVQAADVLGCSPATLQRIRAGAECGPDEARIRLAMDEPVLVDEQRLLDVVRREATRRQRRRRWTLAGLGLVLVAALGIGVAVATSRGATEVTEGLPWKAVTLAAGDEDHLWAITRDPDCATCSILWAGDGTSTGWTRRYTFEQSPYAARILMAPNGKDGWAWFGRDWLQETHDGGKTWVIPGVDLRHANVDLKVSGDAVWALLQSGDGVELWSAPTGSDDWSRRSATPANAIRYALVTLGNEALVMTYPQVGPATLVSATGPGTPAEVPCADPPLPPRSSSGALWVTCPDTGSGVEVLRSRDGVTWERFGVSPLTAEGSYPISDQATFLVTAQGGRLAGDAGLRDVPLDLEPGEPVNDGTFVSADTGFLLTGRGRVLRTDDGGVTWADIG